MMSAKPRARAGVTICCWVCSTKTAAAAAAANAATAEIAMRTPVRIFLTDRKRQNDFTFYATSYTPVKTFNCQQPRAATSAQEHTP